VLATKSGRISHAGACARILDSSPANIRTAPTPARRSRRPAFHMPDRTAEREVIPEARSFGMAIIQQRGT